MNTPTVARRPNLPFWARVINGLLGAWLFVSAFSWTHTPAQATNTWVVGVLAVIVAIAGLLGYAQARLLNTVLAIWLFISAFSLPSTNHPTTWNNAIVSVLLFVFSLVPGRGEPRGTLRHGTA